MARVYSVYGGLSSGHFVGPASRMRGVNIAMKDEVGPTLTMLASGVLKKDMESAANSTAHTAMKWIKLAIDRGHAEGFGVIQKRKMLDAKGAIAVMANLKPNKLKGGSRKKIMEYLLQGTRRFGPQQMFVGGNTKNLKQAVNYAKVVGGAVVGWGSKSSPRYGNAVQEGLRGWRNSMTWKGTQMYTDKQRRFFAAIGLPISKSKMFQHQPKAAFFEPMMKHKERSGALGRVFNQKLEATIKRRLAKAAAKATVIAA